MEFKDIKCDYQLYKNFYAVAKAGSFSGGAKALFLTQPTVSYNIKSLENGLGCKLFFRDSRSVKLTPEGRLLYKYIDSAHNAILSGEKEIEKIYSLERGEIAVGVPVNYNSDLICNIVEGFKQKYPKIKIKLFFRSTQELLDMFDAYKLDIVFTFRESVKNRNNANVVKIMPSTKLCFAGTKEYVEDKPLTELEFILPNRKTTMRSHIDSFFNKIAFTPASSLETFTTESMLSLTKKGFGVGLFYKDSIEEYINNGSFTEVEFNQTIPSVKLCYLYKESFMDYSCKIFTDWIDEYVDKD